MFSSQTQERPCNLHEQNKRKLHVCFNSCTVFSQGHPQKKVSPAMGKDRIKNVTCASFVNHSCSSCRKCSQCCQNSTSGGTSGKSAPPWVRVVSILKEGYNLSFNIKPPLTGNPIVKSRYANPLRNSYLQELLHSLSDEQATEQVKVQSCLTFYKCFFLVPKPNNKWCPILDLSSLNPTGGWTY